MSLSYIMQFFLFGKNADMFNYACRCVQNASLECTYQFQVTFSFFLAICQYSSFYLYFPSSAESADTLTALSTQQQFLDQVPFLCSRLELCILWYMVHNTPYNNATNVTVGINDYVHRLSLLSLPPLHPSHRGPIPVGDLCLSILVVSQIYAISVVSFSFICIFFICSFNTLDNNVLLSPSQHCIVLFNSPIKCNPFD